MMVAWLTERQEGEKEEFVFIVNRSRGLFIVETLDESVDLSIFIGFTVNHDGQYTRLPPNSHWYTGAKITPIPAELILPKDIIDVNKKRFN